MYLIFKPSYIYNIWIVGLHTIAMFVITHIRKVSYKISRRVYDIETDRIKKFRSRELL
jgi:hypothetical protein